MVGSGIPYSPFERAATRPKLNAMQFRYRVGSNFITGAPPQFEDLLTLQLCMNPNFNNPNCHILKQGFKQVNLPDQVRNETAICMRMTKLRPFLEAQNFHHKLRILLEAIIECKFSLDTRQSHDYLQYERHAYNLIAAFSSVIEPQQDGRLHWHIILYSSVLSLELLEKAAAAPTKLQTQVAEMLDSITCTTLPPNIHQWYNDTIATIQHGTKCPWAADMDVLDDGLYSWTVLVYSVDYATITLQLCKKKHFMFYYRSIIYMGIVRFDVYPTNSPSNKQHHHGELFATTAAWLKRIGSPHPWGPLWKGSSEVVVKGF